MKSAPLLCRANRRGAQDVNKPHTSLPAPLGRSLTMNRWLARTTNRVDPAVRWMAAIDDGCATSDVSLDEIRAVRVEDLSQVLDHRIARTLGGTSHVIGFIGGGELRYAYNDRGEVIELSATGIKGDMSPSRVVTFGTMSRNGVHRRPRGPHAYSIALGLAGSGDARRRPKESRGPRHQCQWIDPGRSWT